MKIVLMGCIHLYSSEKNNKFIFLHEIVKINQMYYSLSTQTKGSYFILGLRDFLWLHLWAI